MNRILRAQGAVAPPTLCPNRASDEQLMAWLHAHLAGLKRLRTSVLAGDWTSYSEVRAEEDVDAARQRHQTALDQVRTAIARPRESQ